MADDDKKDIEAKDSASHRDIMAGYAANTAYQGPHKDYTEALEAFEQKCDVINKALTKTVEVSSPTRNDPNNMRSEKRTLAHQIRSLNKKRLRASEETKRTEIQDQMNALLAGALKWKGAAPTREGKVDADANRYAQKTAIEAYSDAVREHVAGRSIQTEDQLNIFKAAAESLAAPADDQQPEQGGLGPAPLANASDRDKAKYARNQQYLQQIEETRKLNAAIAATATVASDRHLLLAGRRALNWLPEGVRPLDTPGMSLLDEAKRGRFPGGIDLIAFEGAHKGVKWVPGKNGGSGSFSFEGDISGSVATAMIAALVNRKSVDGGADIAALTMSNGGIAARRNAGRSAIAFGVGLEFNDSREYESLGPRATEILAALYLEIVENMRKGDKVFDCSESYAQLYSSLESKGQMMPRLRKELWKSWVHGHAGKTGIALTQAMKGLHAKFKEDGNVQKGLKDCLNEAALAYGSAGTKKFISLLFDRRKENPEALGEEVRLDIARAIMMNTDKYAEHYLWTWRSERQAVKELVAEYLQAGEVKELAGEIYTEVGLNDTHGLVSNFLAALSSKDKRYVASEAKAKNPAEAGLFDMARSGNLSAADRALLIAEYKKEKQSATEADLNTLTKEKVKGLAQIKPGDCKRDGAGALTLAGFSNEQKAVLLAKHNEGRNPAETEVEIKALDDARFRQLCKDASNALSSKIQATDPVANMALYSDHEKGLLLAEYKKTPANLSDANGVALSNDQIKANLNQLRVSEVKALVDDLGSWNPKKAALDAMIDKALENVADNDPAARAEALKPLVTIVAKQAIAGNSLTNRTTSRSWGQVGKQAGAGVALGFAGVLGLATSPLIGLAAAGNWAVGGGNLLADMKPTTLIGIVKAKNVNRAQEVEVAELIGHIAERGREGVDAGQFRTAFVGGDLNNPEGDRANGLKERIIAAGIDRPEGGKMPSVSRAGNLVRAAEEKIRNPGPAAS